MIVSNEENLNDGYIALGSFDGLHKGHMSLINKAISLAEENQGRSIVYTFKNHPKTVLDHNSISMLLMDNSNKEKILYNEGIDLVYFEEFNKEFMKKSPEEFIEYICNKFKVKGIVVGFNYRFGYRNLGDVNLLKKLQSKYGYKLYVMKSCSYLGEVISSTRIREDLLKGNLKEANEMLERPYFIEGNVTKGKQLGRTIGFPTANLKYEKNILLPKEGVYYTNLMWNNKIYKGITSIGNTPTVEIKGITIETFILNFNKDIYDDKIKLFFIKYLRNNVKFNSLNELTDQLNKDKIKAEKENLIIK